MCIFFTAFLTAEWCSFSKPRQESLTFMSIFTRMHLSVLFTLVWILVPHLLHYTMHVKSLELIWWDVKTSNTTILLIFLLCISCSPVSYFASFLFKNSDVMLGFLFYGTPLPYQEPRNIDRRSISSPGSSKFCDYQWLSKSNENGAVFKSVIVKVI